MLAPSAAAGRTDAGVLVAAGTGDNMGAALGLTLMPGDVVVSLGTSGTVFTPHDRAIRDESGAIAGFADATGRHLPLMCTLNAARVLGATAAMLRVDLAQLDGLALAADPGAGGLTLLPYLDGERTPDLPDSTGTLSGLTRSNATPENLARAAVEGMLCNLVGGVDALRRHGVAVERILLIGGAAASRAVREVAPGLFGAPVVVPTPGEYVGIGAARQAAWALAGGAEPPSWALEIDSEYVVPPARRRRQPTSWRATRTSSTARTASDSVQGPEDLAVAVPGRQASALALRAENSSAVMAPASSSSLALAIWSGAEDDDVAATERTYSSWASRARCMFWAERSAMPLPRTMRYTSDVSRGRKMSNTIHSAFIQPDTVWSRKRSPMMLKMTMR